MVRPTSESMSDTADATSAASTPGALEAEPGESGSASEPSESSHASEASEPSNASESGATDETPESKHHLSDRAQRNIALLIAVAVVVVVIVVSVISFQGLGEGPTDAEAITLIEDLGFTAPEGEGSFFTAGGTYEIQSIEILSTTKREDTSGELIEDGLQSTYYYVEAIVTASNGSVEATRYCSVWLGRPEGFDTSWVLLGSLYDSGTTFVALVGLDAQAVEEDLVSTQSSVLAAAGDDLQALYDGGSLSVSDGTFDETLQTTTFTITLSKDSTYSSLSGTLTVIFGFSEGSWEIWSVSASDGIETASYQNLVGTWTGSLSSQLASEGAYCLAGETRALTLTITEVDDTTGTITGTLSGIVHYHDAIDVDTTITTGDTYLNDVSFTVTLADDFDATSSSVAGQGIAGSIGGSVVLVSDETQVVELQLTLVEDGEGGHVLACLYTSYTSVEDSEDEESEDEDSTDEDEDSTDDDTTDEEDAAESISADEEAITTTVSYSDIYVLAEAE